MILGGLSPCAATRPSRRFEVPQRSVYRMTCHPIGGYDDVGVGIGFLGGRYALTLD